jgi:hypothetical protein
MAASRFATFLESQAQVEQRMRPEEIVEAVRRAQEWKPVDQQR